MVWVIGSLIGLVVLLLAVLAVLVLHRRARIRALQAEYRRRWGDGLRQHARTHEAHEHEMHRALADAGRRMAEHRRRLRESKNGAVSS